MLTVKQRNLLVFLRDYIREKGRSPTYDEMRLGLNLRSKSGIHRMICALEERGFVRRVPAQARCIEIAKMPEAVVSFPHRLVPEPIRLVHVTSYGRIGRSTPASSLVPRNEPVEVTSDLAPNPDDYFVVEVSGDFLIRRGIADGDRLLLRRDVVDTGDLVLAVVDESEATIARLRRRGPSVALESTDETFIRHAERVRIMGRVCALLRNFIPREEEAAAAG